MTRTLALALLTFSWLPSVCSVSSAATYEDVKANINTNCAHCHNPQGAAFFLPFNSLGEIKGNQDAMISAIEDDYMPMDNVPGFKNSPAGVALLNWLRTGTDLRDQPPPATPPHILMRDPRTLSYADVKPIIDRQCVGCHNPNGRMPRKRFDTLTGILRYADEMWDELDQGKMPFGDPEFRFTEDGRALMGWLRYGPETNPPAGGNDDDNLPAGDDD